jgi:WD40 repeat protein
MGKVFSVSDDGNQFIHVLKNPSDSVRLVNANGSHASSFRVADELTTALEFSPDGRTVITGAGYAECAIKLWDMPVQKLVGSLLGHRSWVSCLKVLPDGKTLASASADRTVRLWDLETRRPIRTLRGHGGELWTLDASPDGRWLASGGKDGSVILWNLPSSTNRPPAYRTLPRSGAGWWYPSPDGRLLCVLRQKRLELYDAATLQLVSEPALTLTNITGFAFSPDMRLLVVTDAQGNLGAWDMADQRMTTNIVAHPAAAFLNPVFVGTGNSILTYGVEKVLKEWDVATWREIRQWSLEPGPNTWVAYPSANLVAAGSLGGAFELISLHRPGERRRFIGQNRIKAVDLSPDGKTFAAASENGTLELWDTQTVTRRALLRGVLLGYHSVAISPDGERVVAGSNGQEAIKIWDLNSQDEVATLQGEGSYFVNAAFSPDGNTIGAANWKGVIHLWTAPSWKEIESAERSRTIDPPR